MKRVLLLHGLCCICLCQAAVSQNKSEDSASFQSAYAKSIEIYHQSIYPSTTLYNGAKYTGYPFPFKEGHPYFISAVTGVGSIEKGGVLYNDVKFLFDIVRERLIVFSPEQEAILITNDLIKSFAIHNYHFIHVRDQNASIRAGYYALLYDGSVQVLWKNWKIIRSVIEQSSEQRYIDERNQYYLKKGDKYYPISGKRDVLKILKDKKAELQQLIRKEDLSFRKSEIAKSLTRIAGYYDQLIKQ
ncbi:hypothetical protein [Pollutibacter soli]|uniref:hypothetical protein n=1 Tax=Pollutibacter soli TaxID=3034157 RepID=UPI003013DE6D